MKKLDLTGQRFGRLVALEPAENKNGRRQWHCQCDCGNKSVTYAKTLANGKTRSCGCLHSERCRGELKQNNSKPIGYTRIKKQNGRPEIKTERGFVQLHIHVMELHLGRRLKRNEVVHHKDRDILNNSIDNLEVMSNSAHTILHHTGIPRTPDLKKRLSQLAVERSKHRAVGPKLTKEQALVIKESHLPARELAERFQVTKTHIYHIKSGISWGEHGKRQQSIYSGPID